MKVTDHLSTLTSDLLAAVARQNISRLVVSVSCVLKANGPLQGLNGIKLRSSLLGDLGSVVLFPIRQYDFCLHKQYVQRNQAEGETPPCLGMMSQV